MSRLYLRVRWLHDFSDEPVEFWNELDAERYEVRAIECFADGKYGYASESEEFGGTRLSGLPIPPLAEIAEDAQFLPEYVTPAEFEARWAARHMTDSS